MPELEHMGEARWESLEEGLQQLVLPMQVGRVLVEERAKTIADNELVDAGNRGQRAAWEQAQAEGYLDPDDLRRWIVTQDERLCEVCMPMAPPIPGKSLVPLNQPYQHPETGATYQQPHAHVRCRCSEQLVLK